MKPQLRYLDEREREQIASASLALLHRVGVRLTEPAARERLDGAGARIAGDRAYLPPALVRAALETAPHSLALYRRDGAQAMRLEGSNFYFGAHTDAPDILDPYTSSRRACLEEDVRRNAILIEALPDIAFLTASGLVADRPAELADRVSLAACLKHSTKPVLVMPVTLAALMDMHDMAALVAGSNEALQQRPLLMVYAEPVSPLVHPDESIRKLLYCAEHGIPIAYVPYAAMGATAPMSQAATIAQLVAESLSALVIHQLVCPGAPFIFGGMASVMDMRTTIFSYGAPEFQLGNTLMAEMAHHFNLPNFGTGGTSDAQVFDGQAILEAASSCLMAGLAGAHLVHDVGLLGNATVVMPEMIVATDEMAGMLRHLLAPAEVGQDTLSLELFSEAHNTGEFVTHPYTLAHFREVWYPRLLYRRGAKTWGMGDQARFEQRVNARTRHILEHAQPSSLRAELATAVDAVLANARQAATGPG